MANFISLAEAEGAAERPGRGQQVGERRPVEAGEERLARRVSYNFV